MEGMCGRFVGAEKISAIIDRFEAETALTDSDWEPTWNAAPTQQMPVVIQDAKSRRVGLMRWSWPKTWGNGPPHVNAIGETAAEKPTFRESFARRRCIVPASAFYEWQPQGRLKPLPFAFQVQGGLFGIAGLWQMVEVKGEQVAAFILLTTPANRVVEPVHPRMAAILPREAEARWLNPSASVEDLLGLMVPLDAARMVAHRVSLKVSNVRENGPALMEPVAG
jgi:putative SOS response-associated peptidase YedK